MCYLFLHLKCFAKMLAVVLVVMTAVPTWGRAHPEGPPLHANSLPIPRPGSSGYDKDQYFQYINVPEHKVFEWGYRRGNPHHFREEYLSQKDHTFKAKVRDKRDHVMSSETQLLQTITNITQNDQLTWPSHVL